MSETQPKRKVGRPQRSISEEELKKFGELAQNGHQVKTIEDAMSWPNGFIAKHKNLSQILKEKRAEGRIEMLETLRKQAKSNPIVGIFLSKQPSTHGGLDFADRQDQKVSGEIHVHIHG